MFSLREEKGETGARQPPFPSGGLSGGLLTRPRSVARTGWHRGGGGRPRGVQVTEGTEWCGWGEALSGSTRTEPAGCPSDGSPKREREGESCREEPNAVR